MKTMLANAIALASDKHRGQVDKSGMPYILHPLKVMHYLKTEDLELMSMAVLHDIVEDCDVTFDDLRTHGMSDRIVAGVSALTKKTGQSPTEYLDGIKANKDAVMVKLCDLRHNMDARRLIGITEKDSKRMDKYCKMYTELKGLV